MQEATGSTVTYLVILDNIVQYLHRGNETLRGDELQLVKRVLSAVGASSEATYFVIPAIPDVVEKGKKPTPAQLMIGREHVAMQIRHWKPLKILCLGSAAFACTMGHDVLKPIKNIHGLYAEAVGELNQTPEYEPIKYSIPCVPTFPPYMVLSDPDWFRDFVFDIEKLVSIQGTRPVQEPKVKTRVCKHLQDVAVLMKHLEGRDFITCDIETGGLRVGVDELECVGFGFVENDTPYAVIIPYNLLGDKLVQGAVRNLFKSGTKIVFHNAKFDLQFLAQWLGPSTYGMNFQDTLLMNYMLDERPIAGATSPHSLKNLSRIHFDAADYKFDFKTFWEKPKSQRNWAPMYKYLGLDLIYTAWLYKKLLGQLENESKLFNVYSTILLPATRCLAEMELEGAYIDRPYLKVLGEKMEIQMQGSLDAMNDAIEEQLGPYWCSIWLQTKGKKKNPGFNPNSPKQVAALLYDGFGFNAERRDRTTAKKRLNDLMYQYAADESKAKGLAFIENLLEYKQISKAYGTYVTGLLKFSAPDGKVHTSFNLPGTGTGRLSANDPALQTIPQVQGPIIRTAFIAPDEHTFLKIDYSQLEYRIAAILSDDKNMIQAYLDNRDIHIEVAAAALNIAPDQVTKLQRYAAKFIGFGILYGRGAQSIAEGPELRGYNWSVKDAQKFIDAFLGQFPDLAKWMDAQKQKVIDHQESHSILGRVRRWPFITYNSLEECQRQALNFPIQSTASDVTLTALIRLQPALKFYKSRAVLIVHDELDFYVPTDALDEATPEFMKIMTTGLPIESKVPMVVEADYGRSWGELERWHPKS